MQYRYWPATKFCFVCFRRGSPCIWEWHRSSPQPEGVLQLLAAQQPRRCSNHGMSRPEVLRHSRSLWYFLVFHSCLMRSFCLSSDRLVPSLDTIVPFETTKAYDMLDIIQAVCTHTALQIRLMYLKHLQVWIFSPVTHVWTDCGWERLLWDNAQLRQEHRCWFCPYERTHSGHCG